MHETCFCAIIGPPSEDMTEAVPEPLVQPLVQAVPEADMGTMSQLSQEVLLYSALYDFFGCMTPPRYRMALNMHEPPPCMTCDSQHATCMH